MIAFIDTSVLLRVVLRQTSAMREWKQIDRGVVSALAEVECLRTLDRARIVAGMDDVDVAERRAAIFELMTSLEVVDVTQPVLTRASHPLPTVLRALDAIHLATAQMWREQFDDGLVFATHDHTQALAARAVGFRVIGV